MANAGLSSWRVCHKNGWNKSNIEGDVCALLITLSSQVISEQLIGMVKQNGFKLFSPPVFHAVKLLQMFLSVGVFIGTEIFPGGAGVPWSLATLAAALGTASD